MAEWNTKTGTIFYEVLEPTEATIEEATPLTLLHNFMSTGRTAWGKLLEKLNGQHRILLPDLPGHGRSIGYPEGFAHAAMAAQVGELMEAEGFVDGHLAGCSSGGMIAQHMVHDEIIEPRTLALVSTTHSTNPATTGNRARITPENFRAGRNWMDATATLHDPLHYDGYYHEVLLDGFRQLDDTRTIDLPLSELHGWRFPVCIIIGDEDEFFPPEISERMAQALPDAELHIIPRQPHALIFRQPWAVANILASFLAAH